MSLTELKPADILKICTKTSELIYAGRFEEAKEVLGELWRGVGRYPDVELFSPELEAEVLLQCAALSSCLGSAQGKNTLDSTKDMLTRALEIFQTHDNQERQERVRDAQYELGICYWRSGSLDEAQVILAEALKGATGEQRGKILIGCAIIEVYRGRYEEAQAMLLREQDFFDNASHALQGRWHGEMALIWRGLANAANRTSQFDKAIIEYTAAIYHYEQAGHIRYSACNQNNIAFLLYKLGRYSEAHEYLDKARKIFAHLKEPGNVAQVQETKARVLLAEKRYKEARRVIIEVVDALERAGECALLTEALTVKGTVQARLGDVRESQRTFRHAIRTGQQSGASFSAGLAALSLMEEHKLSNRMLYQTYRLADELLSRSQDAEALERLRGCARRAIIQLGGAQVGEDFCLPHAVREVEAQFIEEALERAEGKVTLAARLLGISHQSLGNILNHRHSRLLEKRSEVKERRKPVQPERM